MLFTSSAFFILVIITFLLYYWAGTMRLQVLLLIVSSLIFYAYGQPLLVLLLLFSAGINIVFSYYVAYGPASRRKFYAVSGVVANLLILIFFKYSPLFAVTFFKPTDSIGEFLISIPLPIGISFFTFQGISLVVDVYRDEEVNRQRLIPVSFAEHVRRILFFKAFFPQLIAGPIVKAHDFLPQIGHKRMADIAWEISFKRIVLGYFLKMVVADNLKDFTYWIEFPYFQSQSTSTLISMLIGYSCQIFADFAGYSLIAIGFAKLFGYDLIENFNYPYISSSFSEFWRRWHISLSSFLKEYLYIPMGGNRKGEVRTYLNLMITMLLGGLWHGAAWSYMVWGGFHGLALVTERFLKNIIHVRPNIFTKAFGMLTVFLFVTLAWLLFKLPDFNHVIEYLRSVAENTGLKDNTLNITYIFLYSLPVFLLHAAHLLSERPGFARIRRNDYFVYASMLFLIITSSGSAGSFIYFQF